jgi:hypothetical protein
MFSRLIYRYLWLLSKINFFSQSGLIFLSSFIKNKIKKPTGNQKFSSIYLGSKVFSNCSNQAGFDFSFIDVSTLSNYQYNNSLIILNNNDFCNESCFHAVSKIKRDSNNLQLCIWDFDNHHAIATSMRLLYLSDIYFSAHQHNFDYLRHASSSFFGVLPASVIQWPKDFLTSSFEYMLSVPRSNELFGKHVYYSLFGRRNKIIDAVSQYFPNVCFTNLNYHDRKIEDRFAEWCHYKIHFIAPVDNDLPIRLLDALITGGIPLVPIQLKALLHALSIDHFAVFYDEIDSESLHLKVQEAIIKFDENGADGMKKRINFTMNNHHIDARVNFLINCHH